LPPRPLLYHLVSFDEGHEMRRWSVGWSLLLTLLGGVGVLATDQWPQFRGLHAGAVPDDPRLPDTWSERENIAWKTPVPGLGWSSPVVWDNHIFITSAISEGREKDPVPGLYDEHDHIKAEANQRWMLYDVDFDTGAIRWTRELHKGYPPLLRHIKNSYASETAVTDGERVYIYFGSIGLVAALDMSGSMVWTKTVEAYNTSTELGPAASPLLYKDRLYIQHDNTKQSFLMALDKRTGTEIWRTNRSNGAGIWATPIVWEHDRRTEIITMGSGPTGKVRAYDLDGKPVWEITGMSSLTVPTPFVKEGLLYAGSGYPGGEMRPVYAIRPGANGDVSLKAGETSNEYIAWSQPLLGTYNTSALVYRGYYYTLLDRGFLLCHDARTGQQIYGRKRISVESGGFTSSPWAYNGKIFALSEDGDTFVIEAGPEFKLLGKNTLDDMAMATPAALRGSLVLRTRSALYRITRSGQTPQGPQ
jgi:outer membrane protein assembly factor BamB